LSQRCSQDSAMATLTQQAPAIQHCCRDLSCIKTNPGPYIAPNGITIGIILCHPYILLQSLNICLQASRLYKHPKPQLINCQTLPLIVWHIEQIGHLAFSKFFYDDYLWKETEPRLIRE
jgi:hypothetical protein